jgi:chromate reductase
LEVELGGERIEQRLPGRQGPLVVAMLAVNRERPVPRDELIGVLWPDRLPADPDEALSALLSKVRQVVGRDVLTGRRELALSLPAGAEIDVEQARREGERARAAMARADAATAWDAASAALAITGRGFLPGHDAPSRMPSVPRSRPPRGSPRAVRASPASARAPARTKRPPPPRGPAGVAAAASIAPAGMTIELYERLRELPPYDQDLDTDPAPEPVADLRRRVSAADGLLIATPEYNYGVPGVLKNAIDWALRPSADSCLLGKPVAIIGAAPGNFGSVRAQLALRQSFPWIDARVVGKPELAVFRSHERFDADGNLIDETTSTLLTRVLDALDAKVRETEFLTGALVA